MTNCKHDLGYGCIWCHGAKSKLAQDEKPHRSDYFTDPVKPGLEHRWCGVALKGEPHPLPAPPTFIEELEWSQDWCAACTYLVDGGTYYDDHTCRPWTVVKLGVVGRPKWYADYMHQTRFLSFYRNAVQAVIGYDVDPAFGIESPLEVS